MMIPNEDGLGPSTALLYVARGLAEVARANNVALKFIVRNKGKASFNMSSYKNLNTGVPPEFHAEATSCLDTHDSGL